MRALAEFGGRQEGAGVVLGALSSIASGLFCLQCAAKWAGMEVCCRMVAILLGIETFILILGGGETLIFKEGI